MGSDIDFYMQCKLSLVPDIDDDLLERMAAQIKPVVLLKNPEYRFALIETDGVDKRRASYIWSPRIGPLVKLYRGDLNSKQIITFHKYGAPALFKPSLAEAYASIARLVPDWSLLRFFWLDSEGMDRSNIIGDCHWCRCLVFGDERDNVIDDTWERDCAAHSRRATANV